LAHPGVERRETEEAEGCAGAGEEGGEGYDGGWAGSGGGRVGCFSEVLEEFGLEGQGFGFEEGEEPEGVVEGGEEGAGAAGGGEESGVVLLDVLLRYQCGC